MSFEDYMKLPKKSLAEELARRDNMHFAPIPYPPTIVQMNHPLCYEPGGTCTNPQMDCINCPRRSSTGGIYHQTNTSGL